MKIEIAEAKIHLAIDMMKNLTGEAPEAYMHALSLGNTYKGAGLTPVYILDEVTQELIVTTEENLENKLH